MPSPITRAQVTMIHTIRREIMDEETYRDVLHNWYGCASTLDLTRAQAINLIDHLQGKPRSLQRTGGATPKQLTFLRHLLTGCGLNTAQALEWTRSRHTRRDIERLDDLTKFEANSAIKGAQKYREQILKQDLFGQMDRLPADDRDRRLALVAGIGDGGNRE